MFDLFYFQGSGIVCYQGSISTSFFFLDGEIINKKKLSRHFVIGFEGVNLI